MAPRSVMVSGAAGFVGQRLLRRLSGRPGLRLHALAREPKPEALADVPMEWHRADLLDTAALGRALEAARPDRLYHLAAIANPRECAAQPRLAYLVNAKGTLALFLALFRANPAARALLVSTAQVYGTRTGRLAETDPAEPVTVYGRSKLSAERVARGLARRGKAVVIARSFNHTGRGQTPDYVLPALAQNLRRALATGGALGHGNLYPRRDFLHVEDVLDAYEILLERGTSGEVYNVCRGVGTSIGELLEGLMARLGRPHSTALDAALARASDPEEIVGDAHKLHSLGWCPKWPVDTILDELAAPDL